MSKRPPHLSAGWNECTLKDVLDVESAAITPLAGTKYRYVGLEHIEQQTGVLLDAPETDGRHIASTKYVFNPTHVLYGKLRPNLNKAAMPAFAGICSTDILPLAPKPQVLREYVAFYLRTPGFVQWAVTHATGTKMPRLGVKRFLAAKIPVPPLPVQERIVAILQKADEIRRKREDASRLAEQVLPAMYRDLFGEPRLNPHRWPIQTLGENLAETRYGTSEKTEAHAKGDPVLRIPNVVRRTIDTEDMKYLKVSQSEREKLLLQKGDILVVRTNGNKDFVGRAAVFDLEGDYLFASYLIRLRLDADRLNPHYAVAFFSTSYGRDEIDTNSRTSAGQYNISATGLKAICIPVPPMSRQIKFLSQYEQWKDSKSRLDRGVRQSESVLHSLMARAFSGKLTNEYERQNGQRIAAWQSVAELLPRAVALEVLRRSEGRGTESTTCSGLLMTVMMKLLFLIQVKGSVKRRLYQFVPYHYGPFAKDLYADLDKLQEEGLIEIDNSDDDKTRITLADPAKAKELTDQLPEELCEDVQGILDEYGGLGHKALLDRVYKEFPAYAKKSRLGKKKTAKKSTTRKRTVRR